MRRLLVSEMITLDGFFSGPNGEIDWHNVDAEFNDFAIAQLDAVDTLIFGRVTYDLMASYWPTPAALTDDPNVAERMNSLVKIVFSRTIQQAEWRNTRIEADDLGATIADLKQQPGKDMIIFGSGDLVSALASLGLIDEYRLIVNSIVLGRGVPLFTNMSAPLSLQLVSARPFQSGNVLLTYHPGA